MNFKICISYRGDTRSPDLMSESGGFVPLYLLRDHAEGFDGFKKCKNKVAGKIGCGCPGFSEQAMFAKARTKFLELLSKPNDLQRHVIFNTDGFISTANIQEEAFSGYVYRVQAWCYEFTIAEAIEKYRIKPKAKVLPLFNKTMVYVNNDVNLGLADLIAMVPLGGVELTFITPIRDQYLECIEKK